MDDSGFRSTEPPITSQIREAPRWIRELFEEVLRGHRCVVALKDRESGAAINVAGEPCLHTFAWNNQGSMELESVVTVEAHRDPASTTPETSAPIHIHVGDYGDRWRDLCDLKLRELEPDGRGLAMLIAQGFPCALDFFCENGDRPFFIYVPRAVVNAIVLGAARNTTRSSSLESKRCWLLAAHASSPSALPRPEIGARAVVEAGC